MSSANLQDIKARFKNQLHFYTLKNVSKKIEENNPIYNNIKSNKVLRNKLTQKCERSI